jgi:hypothetical protein
MPRHYHGSKTPTVQFESGELSYNYSESVWLKILTGGKDEILSLVQSTPISGAFVVDVKAKAFNKAYWQATIVCAGPPGNEARLEEVERGLITRKIEYNPRYRTAAAGGPVAMKELWAIEAAMNASDEATFNQIAGDPIGTGGQVTSALAIELLEKRLRRPNRHPPNADVHLYRSAHRLRMAEDLRPGLKPSRLSRTHRGMDRRPALGP